MVAEISTCINKEYILKKEAESEAERRKDERGIEAEGNKLKTEIRNES